MKRQPRLELPEDLRTLYEVGHLLPHQHSMKCVRCGAGVILKWEHEPGINSEIVMPGTVWGKDVTVICLCCSFPHCTHKEQSDR